MKKIFGIILIVVAFAVSSCGSVSKVTNNPYEAEGYGVSMDRDIAYEKAYHNAVAKIAEKADIEIVANTEREYESADKVRGKGDESLYFNQRSTVKARINASDLVVAIKKYRAQWGGKWNCLLSVKVSPDNIY